MPLRNKRFIVVLAIALAAVLIGTGLLLFGQDNKPAPVKTEYKDPWTGEVVSDPEGKTPDKFGTNSDQPIFLGLDKLLQHGLSYEQLKLAENAYYAYSKAHDSYVKEISIDVSRIDDRRRGSGDDITFTSSFPTKINRSEIVTTNLEYVGLSDLRLILTDGAGKMLYDSGQMRYAGE